MNSKLLLLCALGGGLLCSQNAVAQESEKKSDWYFGVGGGFRTTHMSFSDLDKDYFPDDKNMNSGMFSLFVQGEFGAKRQFGVRPSSLS